MGGRDMVTQGKTVLRIKGREVPLSGKNAAILSGSAQFLAWVDSIEFKLEWINEEWSVWKRDKTLVFAVFMIKYVDEAGKGKREIVFFRSDSTAAFIVIRDENSGSRYVVLVKQERLPSGGDLYEIPAGSIEEGETPEENVIKEIREETGIEITEDYLIRFDPVFLSPGACNEKIYLFACEFEMRPDQIRQLEGHLAGQRNHGELTTVRLFRYEEVANLPIRDAKTLLAFKLYENP